MRFILVQGQASSGQAARFDESRCGGFIVAGEEFRALVKRRLAGDCEERMTLRLRCAAHILQISLTHCRLCQSAGGLRVYWRQSWCTCTLLHTPVRML